MEMVCVLHAASAQPHAEVAMTSSVQLATPQYSLPSRLLGSGESPGWKTPQLLYLHRNRGRDTENPVCAHWAVA